MYNYCIGHHCYITKKKNKVWLGNEVNLGLIVVVIIKRRRVVVFDCFGVLFRFGYCVGDEDDLVGCRYRECWMMRD